MRVTRIINYHTCILVNFEETGPRLKALWRTDLRIARLYVVVRDERWVMIFKMLW